MQKIRKKGAEMTKPQLAARVAELETLAAPVLDEDFCDIVVSAVRYALPRHSYMPSLTRDCVWKHWPRLSKMHWCIIRDIRDYYHDVLNIYADRKSLMDSLDLNAWVSFYNKLIQREDTNWPHGERHQHTALTLIPEP